MKTQYLRACAGILLGSAASGCSVDSQDLASSKSLAQVEWSDRGTALTAFVEIQAASCGEDGGFITLEGELTSTGSASFVEVIVEVDGVETERVVAVDPKDFQKGERTKTAPLSARVSVPDGVHSLSMCLAQRGSKGRTEKAACLPTRETDLDCDAPPPPPAEPVDSTPPTIVAERDRSPNELGWYNESVQVSFVCDDDMSGVFSCSDPVEVDEEGLDKFAAGQAIDNAGNEASVSEGPIRLDRTPPEITFFGAREYLIDETIEVGCAIEDALSGVAESRCTASSGQAFLFELGSYSVEATARDQAGNTTETQAEYSVRVTTESLCRVIESLVSKSGIAHSLCVKLEGAKEAAERDNERAANNKIDAFHHEVDAQSGKAILQEHTGLLIRFADALRPVAAQ
jgi:hypothetical protein